MPPGILRARTLPAAHVLTGRKSMIRSVIVAAASAAVLSLSATAFAADHGTADEAKAMLMKAVVGLKADKAKTLDLIDKGEADSLIATSMCFAPPPATAKPLQLATLMQERKQWAWTPGP
jgi:hypothetical protein